MKNRFFIIAFFTAVFLNIAGYYLADYSKIYFRHHLFLDSTGTIFSAVVLGPLMGAVAGFTSNLILGVIHNPVNIPFGIVSIVIGLTAGIAAKKYGFSDIKGLCISIVSVSLLSALAGAIVASFVFGGATGAKLDLSIIKIMSAGHRLLTSTFLVRLPVNLADKGISAGAVFVITRLMIKEYSGYAEKK